MSPPPVEASILADFLPVVDDAIPFEITSSCVLEGNAAREKIVRELNKCNNKEKNRLGQSCETNHH